MRQAFQGRYLDCAECPFASDLIVQLDGELEHLFGAARAKELQNSKRLTDAEADTLTRYWAQRALRNDEGSWFGLVDLRHSDGRTACALIQTDADGLVVSDIAISRTAAQRYLLNYGYIDRPIQLEK